MAIDNNKFSGPGIEQISNNDTNSHSKIYIYSFSTNQTYSFNAFLTDFTDSFKSNWTSQEIYGRMDPIVTFKNTYRRINCSIDVPSFSLKEARYNLQNIDGVIQSLYPIYTKNNLGTATLSSPPLFRVKFANFIFNKQERSPAFSGFEEMPDGLLCYFEGFDFTPNSESGFYIEDLIDSQKEIIPKLLKATFSIGIIHEFPLGNQVNDSGIITKRENTADFHSIYTAELLADEEDAKTPATRPATDSKQADAAADVLK